MATNMFESESWEIIDHYMSIAQQLNTQIQYISRTQNEVHEKLTDVLRNIRSSPIPLLHRSRSTMLNTSSERSTETPISNFRRIYRNSENETNRRNNSQSNRSTTRSTNTRSRSSTRRSNNVTIPSQSRSYTRSSSTNNSTRATQNNPPTSTTSHVNETSTTSELENPEPRPPLFGTSFPPSPIFGDNASNPPTVTPPTVTPPVFQRRTTSTPFTNFIQEFQWTPLSGQNNQSIQMRPFNFFDNVPVYPSSEEIVAATRIIPFNSINNPNNSQCPITLVPFELNDNVMQIIQCGHIFDIVHLTGWFRSNVRCPVCRHDIRETAPGNDEPETEVNDDSLPALDANALIEDTNDTNDTNDTDPEMPALIPLAPIEEGTTTEERPATSEQSPPPTTSLPATSLPTILPPQINIEAVLGLQTFGIPSTSTSSPIWSFNQTYPQMQTSTQSVSTSASQSENANNTDDALNRAFTEMHTALSSHGLDMISNAITQSIRDSVSNTETSTDDDTRLD